MVKATGIFPFDKHNFTENEFTVSTVINRIYKNEIILESVQDKSQPQINIPDSNL